MTVSPSSALSESLEATDDVTSVQGTESVLPDLADDVTSVQGTESVLPDLTDLPASLAESEVIMVPSLLQRRSITTEDLEKIRPVTDIAEAPPVQTSKGVSACFALAGWVRVLALISIGAMGVWPLVLQLIVVPQSVFGDGHGDRYQQTSYYAFENDHYQILRPRQIVCSDLQAALFGSSVPAATQDLLRAVPNSVFLTARELTVNQTNSSSATSLSVDNGILALSASASVCFGGIDDEGAIQIEALLSAQDAPSFGIEASCLPTGSTHLRLRLQSTEFYDTTTMGELNPSRTSGAAMIVSPVDKDLHPVISTCHEYTRTVRYTATASATDYKRMVGQYSKRLLVANNCHGFHSFGGTRDAFGCAYQSLGASGAIADLLKDGSSRTYSFPAPWAMVQCTTSGVCSSIQFTQLWLDEYTVQTVSGSAVLRHNFVNQKVVDVTVDSTFSLRIVIGLQILALVFTAFATSMTKWYVVRCSVVSPWSQVLRATTSCTIAKVVRSSYNLILIAQLMISIVQWRKQITIDMLVGADAAPAVLRAAGLLSLVIVLMLNVVFARAGDLKMQEIEPSFAHIVGIVISVGVYLSTLSTSGLASARHTLVRGMATLSSSELALYSGCLGSSVCTYEVSLGWYSLVIGLILIVAAAVGVVAQYLLQWAALSASGVSFRAKHDEKDPPLLSSTRNTFTRFLDDRSRSMKLYDSSTEVYVQSKIGKATCVYSTRSQIEACGFVPATTILFRYRDLPLFLVARAMPVWVLNCFNITVTIFDVTYTTQKLHDLPIVHVSAQTFHTHWTSLKKARLEWNNAYYGGELPNAVSARE